MSVIYFISFYQFYDLKTALIFSILSPIVELILRFQFLSSFGFRELIFFSIGYQFGYDSTIILPGVFVTTVTLITSFNNFIISRFINIKESKRKKDRKFLIYNSNYNLNNAEELSVIIILVIMFKYKKFQK